MENIQLKTSLRHRFGKLVNIKGKDYKIDSTGKCEVPEEFVPYALKEGFELVNPNSKFSSIEQQEQSKEISSLLADAKKEAEQILADARKEAEQILADARTKAGIILTDAHVDEKAEARKALSEKTIKELQEIAAVSGLSEEEYKNLKKDDLIEFLVKNSFAD